ncbi:hypothetical protein [Thalassiella azotivora]
MNRIARPVTLAAAALVALGLSGCSLTSQQTTQLQYTPSDGSQLDLQDGVGLRNAILVSEGRGEPATLVATVVNDGPEDVTVLIEGGGLAGDVEVPAYGTTRIGPDQDTTLRVDSLDVWPGELVTLAIATPGAADELDVPVLDGTLEELGDYLPTPEPTLEPTPTAGATSAPTGEPTSEPTTGGTPAPTSTATTTP